MAGAVAVVATAVQQVLCAEAVKGGFGPPIGCGGCGCGRCSGLTFPCMFGACVNNPGCECCKKKPPKGRCQWPCMWPRCCQCTPPKFKFKPLKPKPVCRCASRRYHGSHKTRSHTKSGESMLDLTVEIFFYFLRVYIA